jgi:hypothetical protein
VVEQSLLLLRIAFVVLLYLFIWRVVRLSVRDVRAPQESMIIAPGVAAAAGLSRPADRPSRAPAGAARLVVVSGSSFPAGTVVLLDDDVVVGRNAGCDAVIADDATVSAQHARVYHRGDDLYVEDLGSTNGTFVNGQRLVAERLLRVGDVVAIGATELRFERSAA